MQAKAFCKKLTKFVKEFRLDPMINVKEANANGAMVRQHDQLENIKASLTIPHYEPSSPHKTVILREMITFSFSNNSLIWLSFF
jgi:hypothetical protein